MILSDLLIINYHKIEKKKDFGITTRHPKDFCDDLDFLIQAGYKSITFTDIIKNDTLPPKTILITFDDAYLSFYENAYKSLIDRNMKAVVYVPVNYIGKKNDWDVQLFGKTYYHMNKSQIVEIAKKGMEIGSHTLQHRFLNNMPDKMIEKELNASKSRLEDIINNFVPTISYPFGRFNNRVLMLAQKYYIYGVQQMNKPSKEKGLVKLSLRRINIYRTDTRKSFEKKLKYQSNRAIRFKSKMIQMGSWATIIQQSIKPWQN